MQAQAQPQARRNSNANGPNIKRIAYSKQFESYDRLPAALRTALQQFPGNLSAPDVERVYARNGMSEAAALRVIEQTLAKRLLTLPQIWGPGHPQTPKGLLGPEDLGL